MKQSERIKWYKLNVVNLMIKQTYSPQIGGKENVGIDSLNEVVYCIHGIYFTMFHLILNNPIK